MSTLHQALQQRDHFERAIVDKVPRPLRPVAGEAVTRITGIAPSTSGGRPIYAGSETRSVAYHAGMAAAGAALMFTGNPLALAAGATLLISAGRGFTSGFGHHLTHSASKLPWAPKYTRVAYDMVGALGWFASYADYRREHGKHHAFVATPQDPDRQFLAWIRANLRTWPGYVTTLLHPMVHARFLGARWRNTFLRGPLWRRLLAAGFMEGLAMVGWKALLAWAVVVGFGYQVASITSFLSLHLWESRPEGMRSAKAATAVTFARLMIPEANARGLLLQLPLYAVAKVLFLQSDLPQHVLHHMGIGPWTEAPYVLTKALLDGRPIPVTTTLREMFASPMRAARGGKAMLPDSSAFSGM